MSMSHSSATVGDNSDCKSNTNDELLYKLEDIKNQIMEDIKTEYENEDYKSDFRVTVQDVQSNVDCKPFEEIDNSLIVLKKNPNLNDGENIFGNNVVVQETIFLSPNIKEECIDYFCCEDCNKEFEVYCLKCFMLARILDDTVLFPVSSNAKKTVPKDILYLDDSSDKAGIFALKAIPKNVIFGPFYGLELYTNSVGSIWKVKDGKLMLKGENLCDLNWMQFVNSAENILQQNLSIFQSGNRLYYRSNREISIGEELLVYFGDEHINNLGKDGIMYLSPVIVEDLVDVYACTYCCLGFSSEKYLLKHKQRCRNGVDIKCTSEEITQCDFCDIYLTKVEYIEYHMVYCCKKYTRKEQTGESRKRGARKNTETNLEEDSKRHLNVLLENSDRREERHGDFDALNCLTRRYNCDKCSYKTKIKGNLIDHFAVHRQDRPFACAMCAGKFKTRKALRQHVTYIHTGIKNFKCTKCPYRTCKKEPLLNHLHTHDDVKMFVCKICDKRFTTRETLKIHLRKVHDKRVSLRINAKEYLGKYIKADAGIEDKSQEQHAEPKPSCSLCKKVFSAKRYLVRHMKYRHTDSETFNCTICNYQTKYKGNLQTHAKIHIDATSFTCPHCPYKTTVEINLKRHIPIHDEIKPFKCSKCDTAFSRNYTLLKHTRQKHSENDEKKYKCAKCDYSTNCLTSYSSHVNTHEEVKSFLCEICSKGFTRKSSLVKHKKNKHLTEEQIYKCSKCSFRTSQRYIIKKHQESVHEARTTAFFCDICDVSFARKCNLTSHKRAAHKGGNNEADE